MFSRVLLSFLLSSLALCLAADNVETSSKVNENMSVLSESEILATVSVCAAGAVLAVIFPTMIYHKYIHKRLYEEVF